MKKIILICIALMLTVAMAGCQKTPESQIVVGKGDRQLESKILKTSNGNAVPAKLPQSGTKVNEVIEHEKLPIKIVMDATIELENNKIFPAVKVAPHNYTQEEVDRFYAYFVGDAYFADYFAKEDGYAIKTGMQEDIADYEAKLNYEKAKVSRDEEMISRMEQMLKDWRKEYITAVDIAQVPSASKTLNSNYFRGSAAAEGIAGIFEREGRLCRLVVENDEAGKQGKMEFWRNASDTAFQYADGTESPNVLYAGEDIAGINYADALATAEDAIKGIGAYDAGMRLADVQGTEYPNAETNSYYEFIYTREINGINSNYDMSYLSADTYSGSEENRPENIPYIEPWPYEQVYVRVDSIGIQSVSWKGALDVVETLTDNTALLPFEDIKDCFTKMAFIKNSYVEDMLNCSYTEDDKPNSKTLAQVDTIEIDINKIDLSLMRVQTGQDYLLIPVWDFYGYKQLLTEDGTDYALAAKVINEEELKQQRLREAKQSFLTINAIDGSIIDRERGY